VLKNEVVMLPDDVFLVGVINRLRDLTAARDGHWYRIPLSRFKYDLTVDKVDCLAFFLSSKFGELNGSIPYYAVKTGVELVRRRDLLPDEADNPRADEQYYRVALGGFSEKMPPIVNNTKRTIAFIYTTWDRFFVAKTIADLYSRSDDFVERLQMRLLREGIASERTWEAQRRADPLLPMMRLRCHDGQTLMVTLMEMDSSSEKNKERQRRQEEDALRVIRERISQTQGPLTLSIPLFY